jgi:hypothetical protein
MSAGYRPVVSGTRMAGRGRISWIAALLWCSVFQAPATAQETGAATPRQREGEQLYLRIHGVLTHPRCLNCHPKGDSPKQGDAARVHVPPIARGPRDAGPAGLECSACHQAQNNPASGVPGAPQWHLAPRSMAWEGLSPGELCRAILDRKRNGNKSLEATVKHLTADELVGWGWNPGTDATGKQRQPVPIAKDEFVKIVQAWARLGAVCPK